MKKSDNANRSILKQIFQENRRAFVGLGIFSAIINLLMLTGPIYMLQVYDRVLSSKSMSTLFALSILMVFLYGFLCILDILRSRVLVRLGLSIEEGLNSPTFTKWINYGAITNGEKSARPLKDLNVIKSFFLGPIPITIFDVPWVPFFIIFIGMLHWTLGVIALSGMIILFLIAWMNEISTRKRISASQVYNSNSRAIVEEAYNQSEAIVAMGMISNIRTRWEDNYRKGAQFHISSSDKSGSYTAIIKAFRLFLQSAIIGFGCALAILQIITPGAMIAASIITGRTMAPILSATSQWRGFVKFREAYKNANKFLMNVNAPEDVTRLTNPKGLIEVRNVAAAPPGSKAPILKNISFKLSPGQGLGIIGLSASGKSTLARLLAGIWMPQNGTIRLDGATYLQWDKEILGKHIGYLPQNVVLMSGTIKENIARFDPEIDDEMVIEAAKEADIHAMILEFPRGYDTFVGNGGIKLSGGQTQRIALARALYGKPVLIVLDEPNANLDNDGDVALMRAVQSARKRMATVIIITHRASAVSELNLLLVLDKGKVVHFGAKEEVFTKLREKSEETRALNEAASVKDVVVDENITTRKKLSFRPITEEVGNDGL